MHASASYDIPGRMTWRQEQVRYCKRVKQTQKVVQIYRIYQGHQYRRTDGLVGTGLMPYKAHSPKCQHFMLFRFPVYSKYEI